MLLIERYEDNMSRYLNPCSDVVFKRIVGQQAYLLVSFLKLLLALPAATVKIV